MGAAPTIEVLSLIVMCARRYFHLAAPWLMLAAAACGPDKSSTEVTDAAGGSSGDPSASSTNATGSTSSTSGSTGQPTSSAGETASDSEVGSSSGAPVECTDLPVKPGGPLACGGEELALDDPCDQLAGFEVCGDESVHRHTSVPCNVEPELQPCTTPDPMFGCQTDSECDEFPGGVCAQSSGCFCRYPCTHDDDCGADSACACAVRWSEGHPNEGGPIYSENACVPANCRSDADCGGATCGVSIDGCRLTEGFYCHTPEDECTSHTQCAALNMGLDRCAYKAAEGRWTCVDFYFCE